MKFSANIIKEESYDPYFKIEFSYYSEQTCIEKGYAEVMRKPPRPEISYDEDTQARLGSSDKYKIEMELLNTILSYLLCRGKLTTSL